MSVVDKTYCEHYRDGLPYCAKCEARRIERLEQLQAKLAEAQAEIEHLKARNAILDNAIADMTEEQAALCAEDQSITELVAGKDKLIEQLKLALKTLRKYPHTYKMTGHGSIVVGKDLEQCDAALLAAERGEG